MSTSHPGLLKPKAKTRGFGFWSYVCSTAHDGNSCPMQVIQALREVEVCVHSFVSSEMDEDEWSALRLGCLIPDNLRYPFSRWIGEPKTILDVLKKKLTF